MTPEQLDEIEKRWDGYLEKNEVERRFLFDQWWDKRDFWDMTKALREAWARCETLRGLADEKAHESGLYARRMEQAQIAGREARAEVERLKVELAESHEIRLGWAREVGKLAAERADLRAEVARLRLKNAPKAEGDES